MALKGILNASSITANCGNDLIGYKAMKSIMQMMASEKIDFSAINFQEVALDRTAAAFGKFLLEYNIDNNTNFKIVTSPLMRTRTKLQSLEVLLGKTGIASAILYDANVVRPKFIESRIVRRENPWFTYGTAANKGGLVSKVTLSAVSPNSFHQKQIELVSGHLDSKYADKRIVDWHNLITAQAIDAKDWRELVKKIPDLTLAGYDANTRNIYINEQAVNPWQFELRNETFGFRLAPIGNELFSSRSTSKTHIEDVAIIKDSKRKGYAKGGSLDFSVIQNNTILNLKPATEGCIYRAAPLNIDNDSESNRDHNVIGSMPSEIADVSAFTKVKNYLEAQLLVATPKLASQLAKLEDTTENRQLCFNIQTVFLSKSGLVNCQLQKSEIDSPWLSSANLENFDHYQSIQKNIQLILTLSKKLSGWFTPQSIIDSIEKIEDVIRDVDNYSLQNNLDGFEKELASCFSLLKTAYKSSFWWRLFCWIPSSIELLLRPLPIVSAEFETPDSYGQLRSVFGDAEVNITKAETLQKSKRGPASEQDLGQPIDTSREDATPNASPF